MYKCSSRDSNPDAFSASDFKSDVYAVPPEELTAIYSHYTNEQVDFNVAAHIRIERTPSLSVELKGFAPLPLPRIVFETIVSSIPPKLHIFNYILIIY